MEVSFNPGDPGCHDESHAQRAILPAARHSCWAESSAAWRCCCHCGPADSLPGSSFPVSPVPSDSTGLPQHQCQGTSGAAKPRWAPSGSTCCSRLPQKGRNYQYKTVAYWRLERLLCTELERNGHGLLVRSLSLSHGLLYWVSRIPRMILNIPQRLGIAVLFVCMCKLGLQWQQK